MSPRLFLLLIALICDLTTSAQAGKRICCSTPAKPRPVVVLTFDDSVKSHYTVARPILKEYGFNATFFITEGFTFKTNKEAYMRFLKSEDCRMIAMKDLSKYVNPDCYRCDPRHGIETRQAELAKQEK